MNVGMTSANQHVDQYSIITCPSPVEMSVSWLHPQISSQIDATHTNTRCVLTSGAKKKGCHWTAGHQNSAYMVTSPCPLGCHHLVANVLPLTVHLTFTWSWFRGLMNLTGIITQQNQQIRIWHDFIWFLDPIIRISRVWASLKCSRGRDWKTGFKPILGFIPSAENIKTG